MLNNPVYIMKTIINKSLLRQKRIFTSKCRNGRPTSSLANISETLCVNFNIDELYINQLLKL